MCLSIVVVAWYLDAHMSEEKQRWLIYIARINNPSFFKLSAKKRSENIPRKKNKDLKTGNVNR